MHIFNSIKISYRNLMAAKFRSFLTILGIIIGVAAVIIIMAIGQSAQALILDQVSGVGSNLIGVLPGASSSDGPPAAAMGVIITTLTYDDFLALTDGRNVLEVSVGAGYVMGTQTASWNGTDLTSSFVGTTADYPDVEDTSVAAGRFFTHDEETNMSRVAVVGANLVQDLFGGNNPLGKTMKLKEQKKAVDKKFLFLVSEDVLLKAKRRAEILCKTKQPIAYKKLIFPKVKYELFFDIEDDPTQGFIYLHGVYERHNGKCRYVSYMAKEISETAEKEAWGSFWKYIDAVPCGNYSVYYYSPHEKTVYKKLQKKHPDIISVEKVEAFFSSPNVIDLYKIVQSNTDWPLGSYSIKALATYLGFKWRDETPSGALSIQWFNKFLETKDETILKRILEYNEDDCKATMVLKDALEKL